MLIVSRQQRWTHWQTQSTSLALRLPTQHGLPESEKPVPKSRPFYSHREEVNAWLGGRHPPPGLAALQSITQLVTSVCLHLFRPSNELISHWLHNSIETGEKQISPSHPVPGAAFPQGPFMSKGSCRTTKQCFLVICGGVGGGSLSPHPVMLPPFTENSCSYIVQMSDWSLRTD